MKICKICRHEGKTRCIICGWKPPKGRKRLTLMEEVEREGIKNTHEFLATMFNRLKKFNMDGTGCVEVDLKIRIKFGDWNDPEAKYQKRENGDIF